MSSSPGTVSKILWHFTGGPIWNTDKQCQEKKPKPDADAYNALKSILATQHLKIGGYHELISAILPEFRNYDRDAGKFRTEKNKRIVISTSRVCCLADIPLMHLGYHANRYGKFAIGFHRDAAINSGFNPVFYTLENQEIIQNYYKAHAALKGMYLSGIADDLQSATDDAKMDFESLDTSSLDSAISELESSAGDIDELEEALGNALSYIKTFTPAEFGSIYCEREWRSTKQFGFTFSDIAMVAIPKKNGFFADFIKLKKGIGMPDDVPVIAWEDLLEH